MVGIVILCHSNKMVDGLIEFCQVLKQEDFPILNGAGSEYKQFGSTKEEVYEILKKANSGKGVLVFVDFGSSINIVKEAIKLVNGEFEVKIVDCPVVEGSISAVAANDKDTTLEQLKIIAEESRNFKKFR